MSEFITDELFWTATQYAAGDLPDDAAAEFEQRLEVDQSAREALAQAVGLIEAVAQAEAAAVAPTAQAATPASAGTGLVAKFAWIAIATAACLALTFAAYRTLPSPNGRETATNPSSSATVGEAQRQLAYLWIEGQSDAAAATADEPLLDDAFVAEIDELVIPPLDIEPTAPDWLIAALVDAEASTRGEN